MDSLNYQLNTLNIPCYSTINSYINIPSYINVPSLHTLTPIKDCFEKFKALSLEEKKQEPTITIAPLVGTDTSPLVSLFSIPKIFAHIIKNLDCLSWIRMIHVKKDMFSHLSHALDQVDILTQKIVDKRLFNFMKYSPFNTLDDPAQKPSYSFTNLMESWARKHIKNIIIDPALQKPFRQQLQALMPAENIEQITLQYFNKELIQAFIPPANQIIPNLKKWKLNATPNIQQNAIDFLQKISPESVHFYLPSIFELETVDTKDEITLYFSFYLRENNIKIKKGSRLAQSIISASFYHEHISTEQLDTFIKICPNLRKIRLSKLDIKTLPNFSPLQHLEKLYIEKCEKVQSLPKLLSASNVTIIKVIET